MVAAISDVRYPQDSWTSDNQAYAKSMEMFSKIARGVWYEARAPYSLRKLVQWFTLGGTGYYWPLYRRRQIINPQSMGLTFFEYGPRDVVPFQIDRKNWQETYAVTMIQLVAPYKAHAMFPAYQDRLRPVSKKRMRSGAVISRMAFADALRGQAGNFGAWTEQLIELRYTLIRDLSINDSGMPIPMGDAGASWSYVVPYVGQDIPADDLKGGQRYMRKATTDDCRLYPNMRLIITGSGVEEPMIDGPAWDWHGMFPPRFCSDDWVTEEMGLSLFRDVFDLERVRQFNERAMDMKIKAQMDPGIMYDQNSGLNSGTMDDLDPWEMRKRLGVDGEVDKVMTTLLPAEWYKIGAEPFEWAKYLSESQDYYLGVNQMSQLAQAKISMGQDGADDLLRLAGPIVRDICAGMETPFADVLEMEKYQILQDFTTARVMSYVGPDGVTPETFDFDPESLVPSHIAGEDTSNPSKFSRQERAKNFARNLRLTPVPGYLHGLPQTQQKLLLLQGWRAGFPLDPARVAKVYGIENWENDFDKWKEFKRAELEFAAAMKLEGASLLPSGAAGAQPAGGGGKTKPGRPPSGNKPPAARTKGSAEGPRATISESG